MSSFLQNDYCVVRLKSVGRPHGHLAALLELRIRDDPFPIGSFASTSVIARRETMILQLIRVCLCRVLPMPLLFDDLIRPRQHIRRYCQADLLGGIQIDHELKFCRLLNGEIAWFGAFQDFVNVSSRAPE